MLAGQIEWKNCALTSSCHPSLDSGMLIASIELAWLFPLVDDAKMQTGIKMLNENLGFLDLTLQSELIVSVQV